MDVAGAAADLVTFRVAALPPPHSDADHETLYEVRASHQGDEWNVWRKEDDFLRAGLKTWVEQVAKMPKGKPLVIKKRLYESEALLVFVDPSAPPPAYGLPFAIRQGWLFYDRTLVWQRRWTVVHGGSMHIYVNSKSNAPLHSVDLVCYSIDLEKHDGSSKFALLGIGTKEKHVFDALDYQDALDWVASCRKSRDEDNTKAINPFRRLLSNVTRMVRSASSVNLPVLPEANTGSAPSPVPATDFARNDISRSLSRSVSRMNLSNSQVEGSSSVSSAPVSESSERTEMSTKEKLEQVQEKLENAGEVKGGGDEDEKRAIDSREEDVKGDKNGDERRSAQATADVNQAKSESDKPSAGEYEKMTEEETEDEGLQVGGMYLTTSDTILMDEPERDSNCQWNDVELIGANLPKLVAYVAESSRKLDDPLTHQFLLTYPAFTTSRALLELFVMRWSFPPPTFTKQSEVHALRQRIATILVQWVEFQSHEFLADATLTQDFLDFIGRNVDSKTIKEADATWVLDTLKQKKTLRKLSLEPCEPPQVPIAYKQIYVGIFDFPVVEVARQLTKIQADLFASIPLTQFLGQKWTFTDSSEAAAIIEAIMRFNKVSSWVSQVALSYTNIVQRGAVLSRLVDISYECFLMHNYETVVQFLSGLESSPLSRLSLSWGMTTDRAKSRLLELRDLFSPAENWKAYRSTLAHAPNPAIPYLALYLQTLTFAEDGNPDHIEPHTLLNWRKYSLIGDLLRELWRFQQSKYAIEAVPELTKLLQFEDLEIVSEKALYMLSVEVEPRDAIERAKKEYELRKETLKIQKQMQKQQKEEERRKGKEEKQVEKERRREEKERRRAAGEEKEKRRWDFSPRSHRPRGASLGPTAHQAVSKNVFSLLLPEKRGSEGREKEAKASKDKDSRIFARMKKTMGRRDSTGEHMSPRKRSLKGLGSSRGELRPASSPDEPSTPRSEASEDISRSSFDPDSPRKIAIPSVFMPSCNPQTEPLPRAAPEKKQRSTTGEDMSQSTPIVRKKREGLMSSVTGAFGALRSSKKGGKSDKGEAVKAAAEEGRDSAASTAPSSPESLHVSDPAPRTRMKRSVSDAAPKPLPRPSPRKALPALPKKKLPEPPGASPRGLTSPPKTPRLGPECAECGSEIVSGIVVNALQKQFHEDCFRCLHCERLIPMPGKFSEKNGAAFCLTCAEELFSPHCFHCEKAILGKAFQVEQGMLHPTCYKALKKTL